MEHIQETKRGESLRTVAIGDVKLFFFLKKHQLRIIEANQVLEPRNVHLIDSFGRGVNCSFCPAPLGLLQGSVLRMSLKIF